MIYLITYKDILSVKEQTAFVSHNFCEDIFYLTFYSYHFCLHTATL